MEEDEQEFSYSVRLSAHDLLQTMWAEPSLADHTHSAIVVAVEKHLHTSPANHCPRAWKVSLWPAVAGLKLSFLFRCGSPVCWL